MLSVFPRRCTYTHRFLVCVGRCESAGLALGRVPQVAYMGSARNLPATPFCVRDIIISLGTVVDHSFIPPYPLSLPLCLCRCLYVCLCVSVFLSLACKLKTKRQSSLSVCFSLSLSPPHLSILPPPSAPSPYLCYVFMCQSFLSFSARLYFPVCLDPPSPSPSVKRGTNGWPFA